jgi:hypothetical protein
MLRAQVVRVQNGEKVAATVVRTKNERRFAGGNALLLAESEWSAAGKAPRNQLAAGLEKVRRNPWQSDA